MVNLKIVTDKNSIHIKYYGCGKCSMLYNMQPKTGCLNCKHYTFIEYDLHLMVTS